jgi:hypothetical protein
MTWISNCYVKFRCAECGREIELQIRERKAAQDMSDLRDGPPLYCAEHDGLDPRTPQFGVAG